MYLKSNECTRFKFTGSLIENRNSTSLRLSFFSCPSDSLILPPVSMSSKSEDTKGEAAAQAEEPTKNKNKRNRKDKPWDNDTIDHWHVEPVTEENGLEPPLEESTFATLFPKYREAYIREVWPLVTKTLKKYGINCELNLIDGSMSVSTTRKTWDPYSIIKARDLIKLLSRSIPVEQALKILDDSMQCDIIKIKGLVRNKDRFAKRRGRLIGPNGCTLKAIELVTDCYVMVQGNTVAAMGTHKKLEQVRRIVLACMKNIHPIYIIRVRFLVSFPALSHEHECPLSLCSLSAFAN